MIIGIGVDTVEIARIEKAMQNPHFTERIFTESERAVMADKGSSAPEYAAGRWAGKEAVGKALGAGLSLCPPNEVEIGNDETGAPFVRLTGVALSRLQERCGTKVHISLTHDAGIATAFVVIEGEEA